MKILLIDDNKEITEPLSKFLSLDGYSCSSLNDGRAALAVIQKEKFDVILMDIAMPEFSGYDIIDALEKSGKLKEQKLVVLSAISFTNDEIDRLLKRGVTACIKKPIEIFELVKKIKAIHNGSS